MFSILMQTITHIYAKKIEFWFFLSLFLLWGKKKKLPQNENGADHIPSKLFFFGLFKNRKKVIEYEAFNESQIVFKSK